MKNNSLFKKILSIALTVCMIASFALPAFAEGNVSVEVEKVDNSAFTGSPAKQDAVPADELTAEYGPNDIVRVSIVLSGKSVVDAGYSTEDILNNAAALKHLSNVKKNQKNAAKQIAKAMGKNLTVQHNLALAANIISADVAYGDIAKIEGVSGVQAVVLETQYAPSTASNAPQMAIAAGNMTGAVQAWEAGYTGVGARIAIIDTGLDIDHQSFNNDAFMYALQQDAAAAGKKLNAYLKSEVNLLQAKEIQKAMPYLNAYAMSGNSLKASDVIISDKIPFGFNYVDTNTNVRHIYDTQGEHGSHVAGIATANRFLKSEKGFVESLGTVGVAGNAPDAQILVMKVFGQGGGAYDSDYMAAIEDAILLGCDSVNLSLGSGNAGMATSATYQAILDKLAYTNTVVVMSAGNSGAWAEQTSYSELFADGVNFDTAGSPGSFTNSLGVASVDNDGQFGYSFTVAGKQYTFNESATYGNAPIITLAENGSASYDYVYINGVGVEEDYAGIDVEGKVVFVSRGSTSFFEKANIAVEHGAIATIIVNNQPGTIGLNLTGYLYEAPCVSITQDAGNAIKADSTPVANYYTGTITFTDKAGAVVYNSSAYTMSSFSSWGVPGDLSLKPEITAPGGNIWSVNGSNNAGGGTDQYEIMSGTSMAAPQVTGMTAALKMYVEDKGISAGLTDRGTVQSLLMSTATPMHSPDGYTYSVFQQGAGLANVSKAMNAATVVTMGADATPSWADGKVKAELGDDPARTGVYTFSFTLTNQTKKAVTYNLSADVFTQATDGDFLYGETMKLPASVTFQVGKKAANAVTVKKNGSASVTVTIKLTDETKDFLDAYLAGAYVEAYVYAVPTNGTSTHSIPVLAYYGSWTDPSMFDIGSYNEYKYGLEGRAPYLYANNSTRGNTYIVSLADGDYYFGGNLYGNEGEYHPEYASMNNQNGSKIKAANYALIRNAAATASVVKNAETGEVYMNTQTGMKYGAYYYTNGAAWRNTATKNNFNWAGTDANGQPLPEGTKVEMSVVAVPEYYMNADGTYNLDNLGEGAFFTQPLVIDNTAPVVNAVVDGDNNSFVLEITDNVAIAYMSISDVGGMLVGAPEASLELTMVPDGIYMVQAVDYADNVSTYRVLMNVDLVDEAESVTVAPEEVMMMKGETAALTAEVAPVNVSDDSVVWTSDDETVATVDANGVVTAVGEGDCVITAASVLSPDVVGECAVTVISIDTNLNAVVWDDEGQVWFSEFNTNEIPNYTKLANLDAPIVATAYGADGKLYACDLDTESGVSVLYTMNESDCSLTKVGDSSIGYTSMAGSPTMDALVGTYFNYVVMIDPTTGDYMGAFDYAPGADLVGITYEGSVFNTYYNEYVSIFMIVDADGNIYEEAFMPYNGSFAYFMGAEEALIGSNGAPTDMSYFQSLYLGDEYLFYSCFNEAKNSVTLYATDVYETGKTFTVGTFADGVWPVAALMQMGGSGSAADGEKFVEADPVAMSTMDITPVQGFRTHK